MSLASEMVAKYLAAESAILDGKRVRLGDRDLTMEDLAEVRAGRQEWEARASSEPSTDPSAPRRRPIQVVL